MERHGTVTRGLDMAVNGCMLSMATEFQLTMSYWDVDGRQRAQCVQSTKMMCGKDTLFDRVGMCKAFVTLLGILDTKKNQIHNHEKPYELYIL